MPFSDRVRVLLQNGIVEVPNLNRARVYQVQYDPETDTVRVLDRPGLFPIPLWFFDIVCQALTDGIHTPGCARNRVGDPGLDNRTIMGKIATDGMHRTQGEAIPDIACYIFAILEAAGCITRRRGRIDLA